MNKTESNQRPIYEVYECAKITMQKYPYNSLAEKFLSDRRDPIETSAVAHLNMTSEIF